MPQVILLAPRWTAAALAQAHEDVAVRLASAAERDDPVVRRLAVLAAMDPMVRREIGVCIRRRHRRHVRATWERWGSAFVTATPLQSRRSRNIDLGRKLDALAQRWSQVAAALDPSPAASGIRQR